MADTTRSKLDCLRMYYRFNYGAPSEDTFRYVLMALDSRSLGDGFARWMGFLHEHVEGLIAIDGKCCRGSARGKGQSPPSIVNAYCHERGVVLAALDTPDKSNEITVLPELLRLLEIKGCVVTLDAMGCQKKVAAQIVDQKGDYLISLKGNQGNLHRDVADFFYAHEETDANFQEPDFVADLFEYEEKATVATTGAGWSSRPTFAAGASPTKSPGKASKPSCGENPGAPSKERPLTRSATPSAACRLRPGPSPRPCAGPGAWRIRITGCSMFTSVKTPHASAKGMRPRTSPRSGDSASTSPAPPKNPSSKSAACAASCVVGR